MLACASRFSLVFHFAAQLTAENFFQPVGRSLRCLDQLAGDETSNEAVASSVFGIVIHEKIIGVVASLPDRKSTRLNSSHRYISYAVFCLKKKKEVSYRGVCVVDTHIDSYDITA